MNNSLDLKFNIKVKNGKDLSGFLKLSEKELKKLTTQVNKFSKNSKTAFSKPSKDLGFFNNQLKEAKTLLIGYFSIRAAKGVLTNLLDTNREMETLRAQLKSLTGSNEGSAAAFKFIQDFAKDTPFQVQGLTQAFIQLRNFGIEPTEKVMAAITNQASKLGASQDTLLGITRALGQAQAKGKLQFEEIQQLAERGVPVYELLAAATGKNTEQLFKMSEKGQLTRQVLNKLIEKMGELSSGSNADAMQTLNGVISNLSDSWARFEDTLLGDKSEGLIKDIVSGWIVIIDGFTDTLNNDLATQLININSQIFDVRKNIEDLKNTGVIGTVFKSGLFGETLGGEENQLRILLKLRNEIVDNQNFADEQNEFNAILKEGSDLAKKQSDDILSANKKLQDSRAKSFDFAQKQSRLAQSAINSLQREIALREDGSAKAAIQYDITFGSLKSISVMQKEQLVILAGQKDAIKLAAEEYEEYNEIVAEGVRLAKQQQDESASESSRLRERFKPDLVALEGGLGDALDAKDIGIINDEEFKKVVDKMGRDYNDSFIDPALKGTDKLSAFADEAARNMQGAFADFLFDPFETGLDRMLDGFTKMLARMAAEYAASEIFDLFASKESGGSGVGGAILDGIVGYFGGGAGTASVNHGGGIAGSSGIQRKVDPLLFANAPRFHNGGFPGLASDEVPIIAQKGERVLSKQEVANGTGGSTYNIVVNVKSSDSESPSTFGQKAAEAMARAIARQEIKSAARPSNILNPSTKFV